MVLDFLKLNDLQNKTMVLFYNNDKWPYQYYGCLLFLSLLISNSIYFLTIHIGYIISIIIAYDKQKQYNDRACCAVFVLPLSYRHAIQRVLFRIYYTIYGRIYIIELTKRNFRCSLHCISFHVLFWKNCWCKISFPLVFGIYHFCPDIRHSNSKTQAITSMWIIIFSNHHEHYTRFAI